MDSQKARAIAYWTATAVLVFAVFSGGVGELLHTWGTLDTALVLGYPIYFLTILGVWKVLGAIALVTPGLARLKEWAYAGIFFNMTGAAASHVFSADYGVYGFHVLVPLSLAALALTCAAPRSDNLIAGSTRGASKRSSTPWQPNSPRTRGVLGGLPIRLPGT
jgi:uncharacterized membrane protein YphA (DoxX/SURF4 family)